MSATHQAPGAGVRRPPRREHVPPYKAPTISDGAEFRLKPPEEPRPAPPEPTPAPTARLVVIITEAGRETHFAARYLSGAPGDPRVMRLRRLDDGAECRVIELIDGPLCDCAEFTFDDGCRHTKALVAQRLIEDLGRLDEGEGVGHG